MAIPTMPMMMSTQPAVCRLKTNVFVVTANARIAPTAISARPTPVFMMVLSLSRRRGSSGRGSRLRVVGLGWIEQAALQVTQRAGEEPGHVHLRYAEPFTDLGLGEVAVEAHDQDALLALGQLLPVRIDGLHVDGVGEVRVVVAEHVRQQGGVVPVGHRGVERVRAEYEVRLAGLLHVVPADTQPFGQFGFLRRPAELLGEFLGGLTQLEQELLGGPADVDLPPLVAEVPLDLAADAGLRVAGEAVADLGVIVVYRLEQADVPDLHKIFCGYGAAAVLPDARADELLVAVHDYFADGGAQFAVSRQRPDLGEQGIIGQLLELRTRPWMDADVRGGVEGRGVGGSACRRLPEGSPHQGGLPRTLGNCGRVRCARPEANKRMAM